MPCNFFLQLCLQHTKCSSIVESSIFLSYSIIYYQGQYIETFLKYASWWWKGQYIKVLLKYPSWWWKRGIHVVSQKFTLVSKEVLKVLSHLSLQLLAPSSIVSVTFSSFLVAEIAMPCNFFPFDSICNRPSALLESSVFLSYSTIYYRGQYIKAFIKYLHKIWCWSHHTEFLLKTWNILFWWLGKIRNRSIDNVS